MTRRGLAALAICLAPVGALALSLTGNDLLDFCEGKPGGEPAGFCTGYVAGYSRGFEVGRLSEANSIMMDVPDFDFAHPIDYRDYCIPRGVSHNQLRDVAVLFLRSHPELRHERASVLIPRALSQAFPCNR